ncbi:MAG: DUF983 domain-containing protein [Planctomycetaceae bacterium]
MADRRGSGRDGEEGAVGGRLTALRRGLALRCPRCGVGRLFRGWFRMHDACLACGASFAPEPGFYLGSIYVNYGVTVIATGGLYALLVAGCGLTAEAGLAACLAVAVVLPVVFFRHARSLLLALDSAVNRRQSPDAVEASTPSERLAELAADDGRAGCAMGVALALVFLFGLGMAVVTVVWSAHDAGPDAAAGDVDLR